MRPNLLFSFRLSVAGLCRGVGLLAGRRGLAALLLLLAGLLPHGVRAQATVPFSCDGAFYQLRDNATTAAPAATASDFYLIRRGTTFVNTVLYRVPAVLNALAYSKVDGYYYAVQRVADGTATRLYKLGRDSYTDLGTVPGLPANYYSAGTIDENGIYWLQRSTYTANGSTNGLLQKVQITATARTYNGTLQVKQGGANFGPSATGDLAFNPKNGLLYNVGSENLYYTIDRTTGEAVTYGAFGGAGVGSAFLDAIGNLYYYVNGTVGTANSGGFYLIPPRAPSATSVATYRVFINTAPPTGESDGASCAFPDQRLDVVQELTSVTSTTAGVFDITYTVRVNNPGSIDAPNVQVTAFGGTGPGTSFPGASSVSALGAVVVSGGLPATAANAGFTGAGTNTAAPYTANLLDGDATLLFGESATITYTLRVTYNPSSTVPGMPQQNTVYATSTSNSPNIGYRNVGGTAVPPPDLLAADASTNGAVFPANSNEDTPSPTPVLFTRAIYGTVFEDVNYGGGSGRSQGSSQGVGRGGVRVELYRVSGGTTTLTATTTTSSAAGSVGEYSFGAPGVTLAAGVSYIVRAVNSTVTSSRSGSTAALRGVQTYVYNNTNQVGGENPSREDAGNGTGTGSLAALSAAAPAGGGFGTIAQSQAPLTIAAGGSAAPTVNVDFGFNFDAVVNTNDTGQGSLRQFILNSNALGDEIGLAQVYTAANGTTTALTKGVETSIFMIPNGTAVAGQVAGLTNQFAGGTATITLASALATITGPLTVIDGGTQTSSTGNSNPVVTTAGSQSTGPEITLNLNGQTGLTFAGANEQLLGLGITGSASASSGVLVNSAATNLKVINNTLYSNGVNLTLFNGATGATVASNVIRSSTRANGGGIVAQNTSTGNVLTQNAFEANTGLAIDLTTGTTTSGDGVTINDNADTDTGANGRINFPILTSATIVGSTVVVKGYVRANLDVELYLAAADPSGFGEGQTYLSTFESRTAGTTGAVTAGPLTTYGPGPINNLSQGTDNVNTFTYTFTPTAAQLAQLQGNDAQLTSTATRLTTSGNNFGTSEFSGNVTVNLPPVVYSVTNVPLLTTTAAVALDRGLLATANGPGTTIASYRVTDQANLNGTLTYNGAAVTATTVLTDPALLRYKPTLGFVGNASFTYQAIDSNGFTSPNTATYTIPVTAVADVATTITAPATVNAGGSLTLTATFTNNGPNEAQAVARTMQLPTGLTTGGGTVTVSGGSYDNTTGLVTFTAAPAALASGANLNATVVISKVPGSLGSFAAVSRIGTSSDDNNTANNTASVAVSVTPQTDLTTSFYSYVSVPAGNLMTFDVLTTNQGPSPAPAAVQTVQLPAGLVGVYASNGGQYDSGTGVVTFPAVALASGQSVPNSLSFLAPATSFSPSATVTPNTTATGDPVPANNTRYLNGNGVPVVVTVTPVTAATIVANLYATVTGPATVAPGGAVTYVVKQGNSGPTLNGTTPTEVYADLQVLLPLNLTSLTINGVTVAAAGGTISIAGGSYNLSVGIMTFPTASQGSAVTPQQYSITFAAPAAGPALSVTATVAIGGGTDPVPADNQMTVATEILPAADLAILLVNQRGTTAETAGQRVSYAVTTTNNSTQAASGVTQTVQLPATLDAAQLQLNGQTGTLSGTTVSFLGGGTFDTASGLLTLPAVGTLGGGSTLANTVSYVVLGAGTVRAAATVAATTPDLVPTNNTAFVSNGLTLKQDLGVALSGPSTAVAGSPVSYVVTMTNNGPSATGGQNTAIQLPAGLDPTALIVNNVAGNATGNYALNASLGGTATNTTASYNQTTGVLTFTNNTVPPAGLSQVLNVQFTVPATSTQLDISATISATNNTNPGNDVAQLTTGILLTGNVSDLSTTVTAAPTSVTPIAGSSQTYTVTTTNNGPSAAPNATQTIVLPAGLTSNGNALAISNGGSYNNLTGVVTFAATPSLALGGTIVNTVTIVVPDATYQVAGFSASDNLDNAPANNTASLNINSMPRADVASAISGPASTAPGGTVSYAVSVTNNGPSPAANATLSLTLPAGISNLLVNGVPTTPATTLTTPGASLSVGVTDTYIVSFTAPAADFTLTATAGTGSIQGGQTANDVSSLTTTISNVAPVANDVVNTTPAPMANTAGRALPIAPLTADDADGTIDSYRLSSLPNATTQGVLSYNSSGTTYTNITAANVGALVLTPAQAQSLRFTPVSTAVGTVYFTYTATDNKGAVSNVANYGIPVARDNNSVYTATPTKGGNANKYVDGDILAYGIDPNGAQYNANGLIYNATGSKLAGTDNGIRLGKLSMADSTTLAANGVRYTSSTGLFTVVDKTKLPRAGKTIPVTITTTDLFGGVNTNPFSLVLGQNPLPVELTLFTAVAVKNVDAALSWRTASEKNNDHFEVERSFTGTDFTKIGQVQGQGTRSTPSAYTLTDAGVGAKSTGLVYYRLRQVDRDGTASYSPVRTVAFGKGMAPAISVYPNPASGSTGLDLSQLPAGAYEVYLLDATGRRVLDTVLPAGLVHGVDLSGLASGSYQVLVRGTGGGPALNLSQRLIKE